MRSSGPSQEEPSSAEPRRFLVDPLPRGELRKRHAQAVGRLIGSWSRPEGDPVRSVLDDRGRGPRRPSMAQRTRKSVISGLVTRSHGWTL